MRKRDIRALRQAKPDLWTSPDPEPDEGDSEGGEPDACPVCSLVGTHKLQCPQRGLWPQELAEQQEQQR